MTNIIDLARKAGWPEFTLSNLPGSEDEARLMRFAALVRAQALEDAARTAEQYCGAWDDEGHAITAAIRAKGTK